MAQYSNSEKSQARALVIGALLLIISIIAICVSVKHHDQATGAFGLILGLVAGLGLYSATH